MEEFFRGTPMNMNMNMMSAGRGGSSSEIYNNVNHHHHHHLQVENDARRTRTRTSSAAAGGGGGYHGGGAVGPAVIMGSTDHIHDPAGNMNMNIVQFETDQQELLIKTQITNHPRYPDLVSAHIECQKVGAPREMKRLLEEIGRVSLSISTSSSSSSKSQIGADPQLDAFMEAYCGVLQQYKKELSKPVEEATAFLNNIEMQLSNLCGKQGPSHKTNSDFYPNSNDDGIGCSDEEVGYGDVEVTVAEGGTSGLRSCDRELKDMLLQKYSGYLTKLKTDFLKTRKKGKLPKTARCALMDWWETHYRWPYPTEEEKMQLSVATGLGQRQINNWFINQRKRHWKPSEDMKFALMENVNAINGSKGAGGGGPGVQFDTGTGIGNGDPM